MSILDKSPGGSHLTILNRLTGAVRRASPIGRTPRKRLHGETLFAESDPVLEHHAGAVFVPQTRPNLAEDAHWGLFGADGEPITAAFFRRGPGPTRPGGRDVPPTDPGQLPIRDDAPYVYMGHFSDHYGHFLLTSLARTWPLLRKALPPGRKFIYHAPQPPDLWFASPFTGPILRALGLSPEDFVFVTEPVRLHSLLVPGPSFEESHKAHQVHRAVGTTIGEALLAPLEEPVSPQTAQPLYLSRMRLRTGTHRITNEDALVEALDRRGFAVAFPEELKLEEQVRLFDRHHRIVSLVGSALHTSLLTRRPNRIVGIAMQPTVRSDYPLIDRLAGNRARYLFHAFDEQSAEHEGFHRSARFVDPDRVVETVLRAVDALA